MKRDSIIVQKPSSENGVRHRQPATSGNNDDDDDSVNTASSLEIRDDDASRRKLSDVAIKHIAPPSSKGPFQQIMPKK